MGDLIELLALVVAQLYRLALAGRQLGESRLQAVAAVGGEDLLFGAVFGGIGQREQVGILFGGRFSRRNRARLA